MKVKVEVEVEVEEDSCCGAEVLQSKTKESAAVHPGGVRIRKEAKGKRKEAKGNR